MSVDALVLALASVIGPLSVAAVYAMLSTTRPTRLLTAYIVVGYAVSAAIGIALVLLLGVAGGPHASDEVRAAIPFLLGAVSLGYAIALISGRVRGLALVSMGPDHRPDANSWLGRQLADLTASRAAIAGVLTHKPGIFYLAALSAITNSTTSNPSRVLQVLLYNAIWFAMPVAALALARRRPAELQNILRRTIEWVWRHQREIMITVSGLLGAYLVIRGIVELRS